MVSIKQRMQLRKSRQEQVHSCFCCHKIDEVFVKTLDDCFTDQFPLLLDFSILGYVERSERDTEVFFLKCS